MPIAVTKCHDCDQRKHSRDQPSGHLTHRFAGERSPVSAHERDRGTHERDHREQNTHDDHAHRGEHEEGQNLTRLVHRGNPPQDPRDDKAAVQARAGGPADCDAPWSATATALLASRVPRVAGSRPRWRGHRILNRLPATRQVPAGWCRGHILQSVEVFDAEPAGRGGGQLRNLDHRSARFAFATLAGEPIVHGEATLTRRASEGDAHR